MYPSAPVVASRNDVSAGPEVGAPVKGSSPSPVPSDPRCRQGAPSDSNGRDHRLRPTKYPQLQLSSCFDVENEDFVEKTTVRRLRSCATRGLNKGYCTHRETKKKSYFKVYRFFTIEQVVSSGETQ